MNEKKIQNSTAKNTELYRSGFMPFLTELSDIGFRNVKIKFVVKRDKIIDKRKNILAYELLNVLCTPDSLMMFDRERFANVLNCFFPMRSLWPRLIENYINGLVELIDVTKANEYVVSDAGKAFTHLFEMVESCKKCIEDLDLADVIQYLVDIYKTVTCLNKISEINEYKFQVDRLALARTDSNLQWRYEKLIHESMSFRVAGKTEDSEGYPLMKPMPKKYINLLSWILIELICDQDGIVEETEEQVDE